MMVAKRTAVWIDADATLASFSTFSCASMQAPQPLIADTASDHSSKSALSTPGLSKTRQ